MTLGLSLLALIAVLAVAGWLRQRALGESLGGLPDVRTPAERAQDAGTCLKCWGTGLRYCGRSSEEPRCEACRGTGRAANKKEVTS